MADYLVSFVIATAVAATASWGIRGGRTRLWLSGVAAVVVLLTLGYLAWTIVDKDTSPEYYPVTAILSTLATFLVVRHFARRGIPQGYQILLGAVTWFLVDLLISIVFLLFEPFDMHL